MSYTKVGENKYRIFISDGTNLDGSRRRHSKTVETNLNGRDLEKFLTLAEFDFEDEVKKRDPRFEKLAQGTFEEYSEWWLDYKKVHDELEETTLTFHRRLLNTRILKYIGNKQLNKITNNDMLELMKEIKKSPAKTKTGKLSEKYIKHHHTLLKTMFNDAVKLKILQESPMENVPVKTPQVILKNNYYDFEDVQKLLNLLPNEPIKYQLACLLALTVGFRIGELTALQWKHVDLQNMQIEIGQSNAYSNETGSYIKDTKNTYSDRTVAFPNTLINLFIKHKENEKLKKKMLGNKWYYGKTKDEDDYVFTQNNGKTIFVGTIPSWFRDLVRKNKLKYITFHGLRHTNTTILINSGINIVSISHNLGHAKPSTTTNFYAHHLESVERKMANVFDDIIVEKQDNKENGTESGTKSEKLRLVN